MTMLRDQYFFQDFKQDQAESIVNEALRSAEDGELYLEHSLFEQISLTDGMIKQATFNTNQGFGLRGIIGETLSFAHASDLKTSSLKQAALSVSEGIKGQGGQVPLEKKTSSHSLYTDQNPLEILSFSNKISFLREIDSYTRHLDPKITNVSINLMGSWKIIGILRKGGEYVEDIRPLVRLMIHASAKEKDRHESGYLATGGRYLYDQFFDHASWEQTAEEAVRQALTNLRSVPAPAGEMEIVLGNGNPAMMLHEAVGHGLESDFNRKKTSVFSELMGQQVAAKGVTVIDDGSIAQERGSLNIDDEGTPTQRTVLIEDGILTSYMHDRLNARLMNKRSTGNGRREAYHHLPYPRMTNTLMLSGNHTPEEIIQSVKNGIYAVSFGGGSVDITNGQFVFTAVEAYKIENGKVTTPIKGATLIGSGHEALKHISMIGNDSILAQGGGSCGKNGQWVPVGIGQPTLKISKMTVGGTQI